MGHRKLYVIPTCMIVLAMLFFFFFKFLMLAGHVTTLLYEFGCAYVDSCFPLYIG